MPNKRGSIVQLDLDWHEVEPDGSQCFACGETIYLVQWRLFATAPKFVIPLPLFPVFCGACYDAAADEEDENNAQFFT